MRVHPLVKLALAAALFAPLAASHGGWGHCGDADVPFTAGGLDLYLVLTAGGPMLYMESNGVEHLQRGDGADPCSEPIGGQPMPDTRL